jgi:hypothetical protein
MQQWHKGVRPETATTWQHEDRGILRQSAATFFKQKATTGIYWKISELEILKRAVGISSGLRRMKEWTL